MKVLLIRLDKIGDLVCTLPVDQVPALQNHDVRWAIAQGLAFVASNAVPGRRFIQLDKKNAFESFRTLLRFSRQEKFKVAVSFQAPWWVSLALWLARVPVRAGVRSQWHSFLFFNRGLRQRRSLAEKHEADYNRELLEHALSSPKIADIMTKRKIPVTSLGVTPVLQMRAPHHADLLQRLGLLGTKFIIVHPGMAGSALNWTQKNYVALIRLLFEKHLIVITGTPADEKWLGTIRNELKHEERVRWLVGEVTQQELLGVIDASQLVIAPSTGVAHLAAALGKPLLSIFSPVRVQKSLRWSPRGPEVRVFEPHVECPAHHQCLGKRCKEFYCLNQISPESLSEAVREMVG